MPIFHKILEMLIRVFFFLILSHICLGQSVFNFVPNPGFEDFYHMPKDLSATHNDFINKSKFWATANTGTTDLIHTTTDTKFWYNLAQPHSGNMYAGILVNNADYAEYLKIELKDDLLPGQTYYGEFWIKTPPKFMGENLGSIQLNDQFGMVADDNFFFENTRLIKKTTVVNGNGIKTDPNNWVKIGTEFKVSKPCSNIYIGQFDTNKKNIAIGYFFIDDVFVGGTGDLKYIKPMSEITANTSTNFDNILFENGKSELKNSSFAQLDIIAEAIQKSNKNCTIIGHTDNEGSKEFNQQLSYQRAVAVKKYFITKGVAEKYLDCIGKGESEPIESNDNEQGKQKNRRVEIILK